MSTPDIPMAVNVQENEISGNLNSSMLLNFLMGKSPLLHTYVDQVFTLWYMEEPYTFTVSSSIDLKRKMSRMCSTVSKKPMNLNRCIVLAAISALYFLYFLDFIMEWYDLDWVVVINGDTRESIFLATMGDGLQWTLALSIFLQNSLLIISDGLLVGQHC
ncbi:hypothetical protein CVT25_000296 [Psilocybe cyanescens]|uniref:Uncharacterized protein n=1 Tax=Psilocybe cyanescens TaxID=93625 RepID=A0A409XUG5_PSICY|nr:hypothetical protein CVT25_000296 [Psilocybe cyanescens]